MSGAEATNEASNWVALREDDGRAYLVNNVPGEVKIKGLGTVSYTHLTLPTICSV